MATPSIVVKEVPLINGQLLFITIVVFLPRFPQDVTIKPNHQFLYQGKSWILQHQKLVTLWE